MREAETYAKQIIKEAKEEKWKEYASTLNSQSPIGEVWTKIKRLSSSFRPQTGPLLVGNNLITNVTEKVQVFADHFGEVFRNNQIVPQNEEIRNEIEASYLNLRDE